MEEPFNPRSKGFRSGTSKNPRKGNTQKYNLSALNQQKNTTIYKRTYRSSNQDETFIGNPIFDSVQDGVTLSMGKKKRWLLEKHFNVNDNKTVQIINDDVIQLVSNHPDYCRIFRRKMNPPNYKTVEQTYYGVTPEEALEMKNKDFGQKNKKRRKHKKDNSRRAQYENEEEMYWKKGSKGKEKAIPKNDKCCPDTNNLDFDKISCYVEVVKPLSKTNYPLYMSDDAGYISPEYTKGIMKNHTKKRRNKAKIIEVDFKSNSSVATKKAPKVYNF